MGCESARKAAIIYIHHRHLVLLSQKADTRLGELKTRDWKSRERIGYGKPI